MTSGDVMAYFAEGKLRQWLKYYVQKPEGMRNRMLLGVIVDRTNCVVIPISWKSKTEFLFCPIFQASLN